MNSVLKFLLGEHLKAVVETAAEKRSLTLDLSHHDISEVPEDIASCRVLEHLYLHCNRITEFPLRVLPLRHLTTLTLDYNNLTRIPPEIGTLKQLVNLNVSHNPLGRLCVEICSLESLEGLWCNNTDIEELPPEIGNLSQLDVLGARGNRLTAIPVEICKLQKLRWLTLENNRIARLPENIGEMASLVHLNVRRNRIEDIPASIVNCKKLAYFRLNDNVLTRLPDEFTAAMATMPRLRAVDMHEEAIVEGIAEVVDNALPETSQATEEANTADNVEHEATPDRRREGSESDRGETDSSGSDEDWENSVASIELDLDYRSDEERANAEELGMALPFLSKYTSLAS